MLRDGGRLPGAIDGQVETHLGADPLLAFDGDLAAVVFHELLSDEHPETDALRFPVGEERLEDAMLHFLGNPASVIFDRQTYAVAKGLRAQDQLAAIGHRLARVDGNIPQRAVQSLLIDEDFSRIAELDANMALRKLSAQSCRESSEIRSRAKPFEREVEMTAARELEQLVDHVIQAIAFLDHAMPIGAALSLAELEIRQHSGIAAKRRQRTAKIVNNGADHTTDGREPLELDVLLRQVNIAKRGRGLKSQDREKLLSLGAESVSGAQDKKPEKLGLIGNR